MNKRCRTKVSRSKAASGKHEARKEFGLIASFHSNVFVCSTSTALQNHFLKNTMEFLTYTDSPAVLDVYTPCQGEHGIADNISARQSRLAVDSRIRGQGLGRYLFEEALGLALQLAHTGPVAFRLLVTDAVDAQALSFYAHFGCQPLSEAFPCRMVLDLRPLL